MAPALGVSVRTLDYWQSGESGASDEELAAVRQHARERIAFLSEVVVGGLNDDDIEEAIASASTGRGSSDPDCKPFEKQTLVPVYDAEVACLTARQDGVTNPTESGPLPPVPSRMTEISPAAAGILDSPASDPSAFAGADDLEQCRPHEAEPIDDQRLAEVLFARMSACPPGVPLRRWMHETPEISGRDAWLDGHRKSLRIKVFSHNRSISIGFVPASPSVSDRTTHWHTLRVDGEPTSITHYRWFPPNWF